MTNPTPPAQSGMPPWARWTMIGCGGCLILALLGVVGCSALSYYFLHKGVERLDMSKMPDPPVTAAVSQLLPPRVGSFTRQSVQHYPSHRAAMTTANSWQATYTSKGKRVEIIVMPTAGARQNGSPFGNVRQSGNPGIGIHMSAKVASITMDVITWSKPNWTFVIQSPDSVAKAFVTAYHPGKPAATPHR